MRWQNVKGEEKKNRTHIMANQYKMLSTEKGLSYLWDVLYKSNGNPRNVSLETWNVIEEETKKNMTVNHQLRCQAGTVEIYI